MCTTLEDNYVYALVKQWYKGDKKELGVNYKLNHVL